MTIHAKVYTGLLILLALLSIAMIATIECMMVPIRARKYPDSMTALHLMTVIYAIVFCIILLAVFLRFKKPNAGRVLSKIVNVLIMYPFFPLGVIIGIYGFWKVDRNPQVTDR